METEYCTINIFFSLWSVVSKSLSLTGFCFACRQVVRCRGPAEWEEEVAQLLWVRSGRVVCCGPQQLWHDTDGGPFSGMLWKTWSLSNVIFLCWIWCKRYLCFSLSLLAFPYFPLIESAAGKSQTFYIHLHQHNLQENLTGKTTCASSRWLS